jgi:mono/diheme cytochrome c family protein
MPTVFKTLAFSACVIVVIAAAFIYSGGYNVAASDPHWSITRWAMETVRVQSVKAHAKGIAAPTNLGDQPQIVMGTEHFAAHCAVCHGAPGVPRGEIAEGLYPQPANLAMAAKLYTPSELFWTIKNGIKMTGMPSWSDHSDAEIWATVAFLQKLGSGMTQEDYGKLVMASMALGGHHHGGAESAAPMDMKGMDMPGMSHGEGPTPTAGEAPAATDHHNH